MADKWVVDETPVEIHSGGYGDHVRFTSRRGDETRVTDAILSGSLLCSGPETLADPLDKIVATRGRYKIEQDIAEGYAPPRRIEFHTRGWHYPDA